MLLRHACLHLRLWASYYLYGEANLSKCVETLKIYSIQLSFRNICTQILVKQMSKFGQTFPVNSNLKQI